MDPSSSTSGGVEDGPIVFLSHAGQQKAFVNVLNDYLQRAQYTTFFDKEILAKGSHFPSEIKRAVRDCKLGVLTLSHEYLSSKWPMLQLSWLDSHSKSILPLFYRITIEDLECTDNLSKWKLRWIQMVGQEKAEQWEKAVKKLPSIAGVVYEGSELAYIEQVVTVICNLIPPKVVYDLSHVQGHQRLAKEIEGYFDGPVGDKRDCGKASIVGLYGVGGSGKTTLCKIMVNLFSPRYLGRSCLIEFPSMYDEHKVVEACKEALEKLANRQGNISGVKSFDKVVELMKKHVSKSDVFLAIDNVWESSVEVARRLLGIGFTANSKVLLTSRSKAVLKELLSHDTNNRYNWYIGSVPTLTRTDAFQIVQESLNGGDLTSSLPRDMIDNVLNRCIHNGEYHALALKALGKYMRTSVQAGDSKMDGNGWSRVLGEMRDNELKTVSDAIKLNYEGLERHLKHMFLDIALWMLIQPSYEYDYFLERTLENARRWLCFFYEERLINAAIYELALVGVILIEKVKDGQEMILMHDLYVDLALTEAANSSRFLMRSKNLVKGIDWGHLERVLLEPYTKMVQLVGCQQIQYLYADGITPEHGILVMPMLSLRVLILRWAEKEEDRCTSSQINFNGFRQLRFLWLEHCHDESFDGLNSLQNLRILTIVACFRLKDMEALRCLTQLEMLTVKSCHALQGILDLGEAPGLEGLTLLENESLEKVEGRLGPALKKVYVCGCLALKGSLDLGEATGLQRLELRGDASLEKVEGCLLGPALKVVVVEGCTALKGIPYLGGAAVLERLVLRGNASLEKVEGRLGSAPKEVVVEGCTALERLVLRGNESM